MVLNRYSRTPILGTGERYGTSYMIPIIRENIANGNIQIEQIIVLQGRSRLDTIAGQFLNDGRLWWILAVSSNIGFSPQVPPGTKIFIPRMADLVKFLA